MRRYEFWVDNDEKLVISEYEQLNAQYESDEFRGKSTYNVIQVLSSYPIISITENKQENKLVLEFEHFIINLNETNRVLSKHGMGPLVQKIKKHIEKVGIKQVPRKKVTRKNKHTKGKIIITGLVLAIILATALTLSKTKANADNSFNLSQPSSFSIENVIEETNLEIPETISIVYEDEEDIKTASIKYNDRSNTDKAHITKAYYGDLINKYSKMYGMDPNLVLGIATQERGIHGTKIDEGGAIGLMQIQYDVWAGEKISAYNFETGKTETFTINPERLSNVDYNIKIGCMVLQNTMEYMDYNTVAAIQCYNMGYGNMQKILKAYSYDSGKTIKEILKDTSNNEWLEYRDLINMGDQSYVEHVFSWMGDNLGIKTQRNDGSLVNLNVTNQQNSKKIC